MKRSEMIKLMVDALNNTKEHDEFELCKLILQNVEQNGMLPPRFTRDDGCESAGVHTYDVYEWEPEDCKDPKCEHQIGWHRRGVGACLECGCLGFQE